MQKYPELLGYILCEPKHIQLHLPPIYYVDHFLRPFCTELVLDLGAVFLFLYPLMACAVFAAIHCPKQSASKNRSQWPVAASIKVCTV